VGCNTGKRTSGGAAPLALHLGTRWTWVVNFTHRPLYPLGKSTYTNCIWGWVDPRIGLEVSVKTSFLHLQWFDPRTIHPAAWLLQLCGQYSTKWVLLFLDWLTLEEGTYAVPKRRQSNTHLCSVRF
jgi:hypothetical protein